MRYYKTYHGEDQENEITYDEALQTLLGTYNDNDITRDMLKEPNAIPCMCSTITVINAD